MTTITTQLVASPAEAKRNRFMVAERLNTLGYVEQELLRARWQMGEAKPARLQVADYGDLPVVLPTHYHPFADWRNSDGRGRKPVMKSWLGLCSLDLGAIEYKERMAGQIEFEPAI